MRADERQRIKDIEKENKTFNDKFRMQELKITAMKECYENEIIGLKKEVERLKKENENLKSENFEKLQNEREKQFIESFSKKITEMQKNLDPIYTQFVNDNFSELLSE